MATVSSRLSVREKEELLSDFEELLGRCYIVFPFPIDKNELPGMYNALISPTVRDVVTDMTRRGYPCFSWFAMHASITVQVPNERSLRIHFGDQACQVYPMREVLLTKAYMIRPDPGIVMPDELARAFGANAPGLVQWAGNYAKLVLECRQAWVTCNDVVDMVNTAGQLRRMIPEMVQFLQPARRAILATQQRSSSLPYEWAAYNRKRVSDMLNAFAKCWLIKDNDMRTYKKISDGEPNEWAAYE